MRSQMWHHISADYKGLHRGKDFKSSCDVKSEHHPSPSGVLNIPIFYYLLVCLVSQEQSVAVPKEGTFLSIYNVLSNFCH